MSLRHDIRALADKWEVDNRIAAGAIGDTPDAPLSDWQRGHEVGWLKSRAAAVDAIRALVGDV